MSVSKSLQLQVEMKLMECLKMASEHYGKHFPYPGVSYTLRGKTAGTATYQRNRVNFNAELFNQNPESFLARTVPHELAHLLAWQLYQNNRQFRNPINGRIQHHGSHWKSVCKVIGMEDITRCHSYDVSKTGRKSQQYVWKCDECGELMSVGRVKHQKMLVNGLYRHKCGGRKKGTISFVTSPGRYTKGEAVQVVRDGMSKKEESALNEMMKEVKKPKAETKPKARKPVGVRPGSSQSKLGQARLYAIANPGVDSRTLRTWVETNMGASAHSARGIWSKLKKEGLVS